MSKEDWRSRAAYQDAATMDPAGLAWEFLRRNPDYRPTYDTAPAQAAPTRAARSGKCLLCDRAPPVPAGPVRNT